MSDPLDFHAPEGLLTRGTVLVVPGRGETPETYTRLGTRLAFDAYRVRVIEPPGETLTARDLADALAGTASGDGNPAAPVVVLGADAGAAALAALYAKGDAPAADALILAGLPAPVAVAAEAAAWDDELNVRTACPTHRGRLSEDAGVRRGALAEPVAPELLAAAYAARPTVPTLLLSGELDPLADHSALAGLAKSLDRARHALVRGAHHDVLNDLPHRSVAAEVVGFLETLREQLVARVAVQSSTW
ncbi:MULTISPECIES: alpha/beta hydrolase [Streptomyces]|uniref:Alpha/beta hydrolase n=1 Tax=Streptomyces evansiae TaxID=3075535 RepID=A0ABD5E5B9_9ACTN|nr:MULTISPECIES: alpha/beta hydrolase [unclassified Streptomyces]ASY32352.1 alpha/beta hydrolase [Streptomyces sp. CLI2509]MDT0416510.1 alpha/beta hydrolase [Streptomyces sp. DSM 41982]MYX23356.1 alpha/beta hydrolase [Streptomyces sp. SID8380]SCE07426.1 Lysophospholipase, alpha-beta hydrolase superfamily [Streptomyces sp. SolWspMP-sol7th]